MFCLADGNETADTLNLLDQEQSAHGNVIEKISIDAPVSMAR
ncbi:MAG: hypothetical protein R3C59_13835 [Planctomycetaceae bacterium]